MTLFSKHSSAQCVLDGDWTAVDATCPSSNDGSICCDTLYGIAPGTGIAPYICIITPLAGTSAVINGKYCFINLPPNTYTVTSTSLDGCTGTFINLVVGLEYPEITTTFTITPASCGGNDGQICATITGGSGNFAYSWTGPPTYSTVISTTNCITGYAAGMYALHVDDLNSTCSEAYTRTIGSATLTATATAHAASCDAPCNGYIEVDLSGATLPASVSWSGTSSGSVSGITTTSYLIPGLCAGTYALTVDDASSCTPLTISALAVGTDNADIVIHNGENIFWTSDDFSGQTDVTLGGNLIVEGGGSLEILDMTIRFSAGHQILVRPQGDFHGINSIFDVGCNDETWSGFSVMGVQTSPCDSEAQRGDLLLDGCTITHAENGVTNFELGALGFGGRIRAVQSTWLNNVRDVTLSNYCPLTSGSASDFGALFEECQFMLTATQTYTIDHTRILLSNISDVRFRACDIITTTPSLYAPDGFITYGVYSSSSQFQWIGEDASEITGIGRGIWAVGTFTNPNCSSGNFSTNDVTNTTFRCSSGVYMNLVSACNILGNTILPLPVGFTTNSYRGIQVQAPGALPQTLFLVADNIVNYTGTSIGRVGITIDNCKGLSNYVLRNTIYNGGPGMKFMNRNRAAVLGDGLAGVHFECNVFHLCSKDISITCTGSGCSTTSTGVAGQQANTFGNQNGPWNISALNSFSDSYNNSVDRDDIDAGVAASIGTINGFRYKYRALDYYTDNYNVNTNAPKECSLITDIAPNNIVTPDFQTVPTPLSYCQLLEYVIPDLQIIEENAQLAKTSYHDFKEVYASLVDGGNTEVLKTSVLYANYTQALSLYESLLVESPALSEEVMLAAINKEYDLPASLLTLILAANPSAAKNPEIWKAINERNEPLDAYQRAQIMLGYYSTSPKEILEEELGNYRAGIDRAIYQTIEYFSAHPSATSMETIREMIGDVGTFENDVLLAEFEIQFGDFANGSESMDGLSSDHKLPTDYANSIDNLLNLRQIQHDVVNRSGHQLTAAEIEYLVDIRDNDACDLGPMAQTILICFAGFEEQEIDCISERRLIVHTEKPDRVNLFSVFPNPTNTGWMVLKSTSPISQTIDIRLYDSESRVMLQEVMKEKQQELFLDISKLSPGVYWIKSDISDFKVIQVIIY